MTISERPAPLAREIARILDNDPIMARQIREYLSEERLLEILEIEAEIIEKQAPFGSFQRVERITAVTDLPESFSLAEVLAAY